MLNVKSFQIENFIPAGYQDAAAPRLAEAQEKLQKHTGLGSEFTDWVRLPENYNKEELTHTQAAAKKLQGDSQALMVIAIGRLQGPGGHRHRRKLPGGPGRGGISLLPQL